MPEDTPLAILLKLQQLILIHEDTANLLNIILPKILLELSDNKLNLTFLEFGILTAQYNIDKCFYADSEHLQTLPRGLINYQALLADPKIIQNLNHDNISTIDLSDINLPNLFNGPSKTSHLVICVVKMPINLTGLLVIGLGENNITPQDLNFFQSITYLLTNAYKLQDTQTSLLTITQEVYKMNAKLHQLDHLKDDFVSVASHELRTPMTAIRSYAWMALNRPDTPISDKTKRYLSRVLSSTERLINLVNDMLNVSRIESGRIEITPKEFEITALFSEVFTEIEPKVKERNLHLQMSQDHLPKVFADPDKVHQVLLNILGNALKFTPSGGLILISFLNDGQFLEISIKDSGVGISSDDMTRLFQKFGKLDNSYVAAATSGGTGLGLYICKSLITLMGGKIWAHSDGLNKGTTFTFTLPVATTATLEQASKFTNHVEGEAKILEPVAI